MRVILKKERKKKKKVWPLMSAIRLKIATVSYEGDTS